MQLSGDVQSDNPKGLTDVTVLISRKKDQKNDTFEKCTVIWRMPAYLRRVLNFVKLHKVWRFLDRRKKKTQDLPYLLTAIYLK